MDKRMNEKRVNAYGFLVEWTNGDELIDEEWIDVLGDTPEEAEANLVEILTTDPDYKDHAGTWKYCKAEEHPDYMYDDIVYGDDDEDDEDDDYEDDEDDYFDDEDENAPEIKDDFGYEKQYAETNGISELSLRGWIAAETALDREIPYWLIEEMEASSEIPLDEMTNEELRTLFINNLEE